MRDSIRIHGFVFGLPRGLFRLLRCNPMCEGGHDPVKPKKAVPLDAEPTTLHTNEKETNEGIEKDLEAEP